MSLADAELLYARLYKQRRTSDKVELLRQIYLRYRPETLKFFVKVITGNLRIGLQSKMVEEAIAEAASAKLDDVRVANNRLGDLSRIALAARQGTLHDIEARLFHPMDFMLAKPLDVLDDLDDPGAWWIEDKYDGFRSQVHVEDGRVAVFTRGMEDVTEAFPDIVEAFLPVVGGVVVDGEILAWRDDRALPFAVLQQRITRKKVPAGMVESVPVVFMAYDLLYADGRMLIGDPIERRRELLASALSRLSVRIAPQWSSPATSEIDAGVRCCARPRQRRSRDQA